MSTAWRKSAVAAVADTRKHNVSSHGAVTRQVESSAMVDKCIQKHLTRQEVHQHGAGKHGKALYIQ